MTASRTILLLEDEAFVLMGLEMAAQDLGHTVLTALNAGDALNHIASHTSPDVAVLDVNLGAGETCEPVASELKKRAIPFVLHSGDLDKGEETVRAVGVPLIPKPAAPEHVIDRALALL